MDDFPERISRKVEHIDANLYRCVDEYEKFTIEALGTTEELAIQNATTDELIREYMQDHQQIELTRPRNSGVFYYPKIVLWTKNMRLYP